MRSQKGDCVVARSDCQANRDDELDHTSRVVSSTPLESQASSSFVQHTKFVERPRQTLPASSQLHTASSVQSNKTTKTKARRSRHQEPAWESRTTTVYGSRNVAAPPACKGLKPTARRAVMQQLKAEPGSDLGYTLQDDGTWSQELVHKGPLDEVREYTRSTYLADKAKKVRKT